MGGSFRRTLTRLEPSRDQELTVDLPAGLTSRPLDLPDAAAVTAVMAADELATFGRVSIEEADIVGDWQRPSFDVPASTIGVLDGSALVGYAEVGSSAGRGDAAVHPDHLGRGIGTFLARWMQQAARARGDHEIGMSVPEGSSGEELLRALGYEQRWTSWVLELPEGCDLPETPLPRGHVLRVAESDEDRTSLWTVLEDAFLEWSVRDRETYDDWAAGSIGRPGFEPWNLRVVVDADGEVVGGAHVVLSEGGAGYVNRVAVRKDRRGEGLARALLADAFAAARAHGADRSELDTDSRTGALGLYTGLGMQVRDTWVHLTKTL